MKYPENIQAVAALVPDYMGYIFYDKSPRFVGTNFEDPQTYTDVQKVAVFVNEVSEEVVEKSKRVGARFVQLHGSESVQVCEQIRSAELTVIKVFSVHDNFSFSVIEPYEGVVDYVLFDTRGKNAGGNGFTFDWSLLRKYNQRIPFFLSGGIHLGNIELVKELLDMNIHAIDLNSGVETSPGVKDVEKVQNALAMVNSFRYGHP